MFHQWVGRNSIEVNGKFQSKKLFFSGWIYCNSWQQFQMQFHNFLSRINFFPFCFCDLFFNLGGASNNFFPSFWQRVKKNLCNIRFVKSDSSDLAESSYKFFRFLLFRSHGVNGISSFTLLYQILMLRSRAASLHCHCGAPAPSQANNYLGFLWFFSSRFGLFLWFCQVLASFLVLPAFFMFSSFMLAFAWWPLIQDRYQRLFDSKSLWLFVVNWAL